MDQCGKLITLPGLIYPKGKSRLDDSNLKTLINVAETNGRNNAKSRNCQQRDDSSSFSCSIFDSCEKYYHPIDIEKTVVLNACYSFCTTSICELKRNILREHTQSKTMPPTHVISNKLRQIFLEEDDTQE